MSLQTDQAAKLAKRSAAHATQKSNADAPAAASPVVNTDPPTVLSTDKNGNVIAPVQYPAPPF